MAFDGKIDIGTQFFTDRLHALHDAPDILGGQVAGVGIVTGLAEFGIGFGRDTVALKLECGPAEFFRFGFPHLRTPGVRIFDSLHHLHGAIEADAVAKLAAQQIRYRRIEQAAHQVK